VPAPRPRKISEFKPLFTNLAQTSHYQVIFGGLSGSLRSYLRLRGVDSRFIGESVGLLCNSASLPGSSFATADIVGNYTGVAEKMAHTRTFTQIDLEFYVDRSYRTIKFLEHWMEFVSSGSREQPYQDGYYFRMRYPDEYKCNATRIVKFDRDYKNYIEYTFYGLFPLTLNSTAISYESSGILKASASFSYERYVCGRTYSIDIARNADNNLVPELATNFLNETNLNKPVYVPVSPGAASASGVRFRPVNVSTGEAIVTGQLYNTLSGGISNGYFSSSKSSSTNSVIGTRRVI
jgi:hypothetical protein